MKNSLAALSIALAACGGGDFAEQAMRDRVISERLDPDGDGVWQFDVESDSGFKLRYKPYLPDNGNIFTQASFYERKWETLKVCAGLDAPMIPPVVLVDRATGILGANPAPGVSIGGRFFAGEPPLIAVYGVFNQEVEHEWLHYLLLIATGHPDAAHTSPLWVKCTRG